MLLLERDLLGAFNLTELRKLGRRQRFGQLRLLLDFQIFGLDQGASDGIFKSCFRSGTQARTRGVFWSQSLLQYENGLKR